MKLLRRYYWVLLLLCSSVLFAYPLLRRLPQWGIQDWDQHMAITESSRQTILSYHQFPLWNPYRCGGMTDIGQPQSRFLWPFFPIILLLGSPVGHKIIFVLHIMIASTGMFLLARYWKISFAASLYAALLYAYSGLFTVPFATGMTNFVTLAWIPWLALCIYISSEKKIFLKAFPFIVVAALIMTWMFFGGWNYMPIIGFLVCILYGTTAIAQKSWYPVYFGVLVLCLFIGFSAVKLFSSIETIYWYPRFVPIRPNDGYTLNSLLFSLLSRNQTIGGWQSFLSGKGPASFDIDENGMYVGIYSVILFFLGCLENKSSRKLLTPMLIFLWIIFGINISPSLYKALHSLPVFSMMMVAQRYKYSFMIFFALIAGIGFNTLGDFVAKLVTPKYRTLLTMTILAGVFLDLFWVNTQIFSFSFETTPREIPRSSLFHQTASSYTGYKNHVTTYATPIREYPSIHANYGSITCYESLPLPYSSVHSYTDPTYRGEVYLLHDHNPVRYSWSPNIIRVSLPTEPRMNDLLIVNQNYDPNWWIMRNKKMPERAMGTDGLLSFPINMSDTTVTLFYLPLSFVYGALVTTISCIAVAAISIGLARKRRGSLGVLTPNHQNRSSVYRNHTS